MNNLAKVIALGGRRLNKALAMHYLFAEKGEPGYCIDDYVHDAANLFLDGIWNAGEGVHNDTLTSWVDLSGNCQPTPLNTGNTVGTNCITGDGTLYGRMTVPDVDPINLTTFTLELVFKHNSTKGGVILDRNYVNSYYVNSSNNNTRHSVFIGKRENVISDITEQYRSIQVTCDGTSAEIWLNGVKKIPNGLANAQSTTDNLVLFCRRSDGNGFDGSIYAVRIHNRILTDGELAQNYELDKARFGLVEPASPEYIEFTGKQYVALDLPFTKDTVCRIKFNTTVATGSCIMGSSPAFRFFNAHGSTYLDWGRGHYGGRINESNGKTPAGKTHYREFGNNYVKDLETGEIVISGVMYGDSVKYNNDPICIMGNPYQECAIGIVYSAEVIQGGETVRSLLPYIGAGGELGFRDTITGKFYGVINKEAASTMSLRMAEEEASE